MFFAAQQLRQLRAVTEQVATINNSWAQHVEALHEKYQAAVHPPTNRVGVGWIVVGTAGGETLWKLLHSWFNVFLHVVAKFKKMFFGVVLLKNSLSTSNLFDPLLSSKSAQRLLRCVGEISAGSCEAT